MSIDEKVNYYFDQIISIPSDRPRSYNIPSLKRSLFLFLDANLEHLLTPLFLQFLVENDHNNHLSEKIKELTDVDNLVDYLSDYIIALTDMDEEYKDMMSDNEKAIVEAYNTTVNILKESKIDDYELEVMESVLLAVAGSVLIKKEKVEAYYAYTFEYVSNWYQILDALILQGICETKHNYYSNKDYWDFDPKEVASYITSQIGDNKREIR